MTHVSSRLPRTWIAACFAVSAGLLTPASAEPTLEVLPADDVAWTPLNPARGDASPQAADLWGDCTEDSATGFLVKFKDGFSSPPHIHNVTYRGVVVHGLVHNDDPDAETTWMPVGSFWTQPAGESHITSAKGDHNVAYIEIQEGPYLVQPADEAFDNGERPINIDARNLVWLDGTELTRIHPAAAEQGVEIAFLWGDPHGDRPSGAMLKLPAGFRGTLHGNDHGLRVVVIAGELTIASPDTDPPATLTPGSYVGSSHAATHQLTSTGDAETLLYVRSTGRFEIGPAD